MKRRLTLEGGVFGSESLFFILIEALIFIEGNFASVFSWVADWVLVAEVDAVEARFDAFDLLKRVQISNILKHTALEGPLG